MDLPNESYKLNKNSFFKLKKKCKNEALQISPTYQYSALDQEYSPKNE